MFYFDTNTCIYFLNGKYASIKKRILEISPSEIAIPSVVKAELLFGAYKSKHKKENIEKIEQFLEPFEIIPFDEVMTYVYADIRYNMETRGTLIGPNDLFIAAIVKFHEGTLITNNEKAFRRIDGLKVENWVE